MYFNCLHRGFQAIPTVHLSLIISVGYTFEEYPYKYVSGFLLSHAFIYSFAVHPNTDLPCCCQCDNLSATGSYCTYSMENVVHPVLLIECLNLCRWWWYSTMCMSLQHVCILDIVFVCVCDPFPSLLDIYFQAFIKLTFIFRFSFPSFYTSELSFESYLLQHNFFFCILLLLQLSNQFLTQKFT